MPMALSAGLTAVLVFLVARTVLGAGGGLLAAAVYLTFGMVFFVGIFCVLDSIFTLMLTGSIAAFYFAHREARPGRKNLLLAVAGAACGLAFLTKGFLALVLPALVFGAFLLWQRGFRAFLKTIWIPLAVMAAIAAPWSVAIHLRAPGFWRQFIWTEHFGRVTGAPGLHNHPVWFYLPFLLAGLLPWTFLAGVPALGLKHADLRRPGLRLCLLWAALPFLLFTAASGKLGTYILPCFAPLAILWSAGLLEYFRRGGMRLWTFGLRLISGCTLTAAVGLAILQLIAATAKPYGPDETWKWIIAAGAGGLWALATWRAATTRSLGVGVGLFLSVPVLMMFVAPYSLPDIALVKAPEAFLRRNLRHVDGNAILAATPEIAYAVCWVYQRDDVKVLGGLETGMKEPDGDKREMSYSQFRQFLADRAAGGPVVIIGDAKHLDSLKNGDPKHPVPLKDPLPGSSLMDSDDWLMFYRLP
ncbi:MAG: glycosyltransferase family 39 protein [Planctomycetota bacterium]|nr:glycosyltransferase family 39 protein [Planctomycetota bacterium]